MKNFGFTSKELRTLRALKTPDKVQRFLDSLPYHHADTAWSPRRVLQERTAHCLEGAVFAAAALRVNGYPPLLFDLEAVNDTDHVIALYRVRGLWGAVAQSGYSGLRFREPVYRTLRELAMSYFDDYCNHRGERTLRAYSTRPVDLTRYDHLGWMTDAKDVWYIPENLCEIRHTPLLEPWMLKRLANVGPRNYAAQMVGSNRFKRATRRFDPSMG